VKSNSNNHEEESKHDDSVSENQTEKINSHSNNSLDGLENDNSVEVLQANMYA
jgi:hypothetical protein